MGDKIMTVEEMYKLENFSVTDAETIRQISLFCIRNNGHNGLADKIHPMCHYMALYPEIIEVYNIEPENKEYFVDIETSEFNYDTFPLYNPDMADKITEIGIEILEFLKIKIKNI
jgi:hypothetical protein